MMKKNSKLWNVYVPVQHHEIYIDVPGKTEKEAIQEWRKNPSNYHCVGEVSMGDASKFFAKEITTTTGKE